MARQTRKKTWTQKRDSSRLPEVKILQSDFAGLKRGTSMVISSPTEIDAYIRAIPYGSACTVDTLRNALAERHGADAACPHRPRSFFVSWPKPRGRRCSPGPSCSR